MVSPLHCSEGNLQGKSSLDRLMGFFSIRIVWFAYVSSQETDGVFVNKTNGLRFSLRGFISAVV